MKKDSASLKYAQEARTLVRQWLYDDEIPREVLAKACGIDLPPVGDPTRERAGHIWQSRLRSLNVAMHALSWHVDHLHPCEAFWNRKQKRWKIRRVIQAAHERGSIERAINYYVAQVTRIETTLEAAHTELLQLPHGNAAAERVLASARAGIEHLQLSATSTRRDLQSLLQLAKEHGLDVEDPNVRERTKQKAQEFDKEPPSEQPIPKKRKRKPRSETRTA